MPVSPFQAVVSSWLVGRIKAAAENEGREIEHLNFKTPLYVAEPEYRDGITSGYVLEDGTPTQKFKEEFSYAVTRIGPIIQRVEGA